MIMIWLKLLFFISTIEAVGKPSGLKNYYTQDFIKLVVNLVTSGGIKRSDGIKLYMKMFHIRETGVSNRKNILQNLKCLGRLHHFMANKINCSRVATELLPHLHSLKIALNMNENLAKSILIGNCSELKNESYQNCNAILAGRIKYPPEITFEALKRAITNCYYEEREVFKHKSISVRYCKQTTTNKI